MPLLQEQRVFYKQVIKATGQVGAFSQTSKAVAKALAKPIDGGNGRPIRVLEAGAGTGALTGAIRDRLGPQDTFHINEINEAFVDYLRQTYEVERNGGPRVEVLGDDISALDGEPYDAIVSSLPLLNMPPEKVDEVFDKLLSGLLKPGGILTYWDYWAKGLRRYVVGSRERRRMTQVLRVTREYLDRYEFDRWVVLRNVPPACVHFLRAPH